MMDFESVSWEHLFFYWFQGRNLLVDDQNFKRGGDIKKREDQISISRRESPCFIGREGGRRVVYHCWSLVLKHISVLLFKFSFRNVKCYYLLFYSFPFSFLMSNVDVRKYNGSYLSCSYAPVQWNSLLSLMNR